MRIYIATKFEESLRASDIAATLEQYGHEITYKWWLNDQLTIEQAMRDVKGVETADVLVFIAEKDLKYQGAFVEFGIAVGERMPIVVLGNAIPNLIFLKLPFVTQVKTVDELLLELHRISAVYAIMPSACL